MIESERRFAFPLGLEVVSIPTDRWPNSVSEHETTMERVVYRCFGRDPAEYESAFVTQWVAALLDGIQRNEETHSIVDSYTSISTLEATHLFYERNAEIDADTRSACVSVILSLGLVRVRCNLHDRTKKFAEFTQNLRVLILDMKQCEQLLRIGIRSLATDSQAGLDSTFDEEIAWREATAFSVENNLKRFIAFTSALLARKWSAIRKVRKLTKRREEFEVATAENVESTIANEIYKRVNEHLSSEKTTVARLSKQIATMRRLLTNTRKVLTQMYTHLYAEWNDINNSLRKVREMLRSYHVSMPDVVNDVILRDDYTTELMKSYEILRNCNTLVLKLTDDTYDLTYESFLPRADRSVLHNWVHTASGAPSDRGLEDLFEDEADKKEKPTQPTQSKQPTQLISPLEENCAQALNELSLAIQATRRHYTNREWDKSPLDIRRLALGFFRVLDTRVRSFTYYNRDTLLDEPSEKLSEKDNNNAEPDQLVLMRIRELEKNIPTIPAKMHLRSLGDNIVALRDTQDAFDLSFFIQSLEFRLNKMLQYRFPTGNTSADKTLELMYDERILEELERATRENFSQLSDEWDSLILNMKTAERNSTKTTGLAAERNLASRIEEWHYRNIDPFKITILNARLTQIDNVQEVSTIRKTVARYAYLLSWMLELRVFLREPREPTTDEAPAQTMKKKKSRKRVSNDSDTAASPKRPRLVSNDVSDDDEDGAGYLQQIRKRKRTQEEGSQNKRRKEDEGNVSSATSADEGMEYSVGESSEDEYFEDWTPLARKRKIDATMDTGGPSTAKKPNIETANEMDDDGAELKRLQRIAELSPSLLNVRLLNDIMEKEHRKQNELFESMEKNMRNIENMLKRSLTMEEMQMLDVSSSLTTPDEPPVQLSGLQ